MNAPRSAAAPAWAPNPTGPVWGPCPATPSAMLLLLGLLVPSKLCRNVGGQVVKPLFDSVPAVLHTWDMTCVATSLHPVFAQQAMQHANSGNSSHAMLKLL